VGHFQLKVLVLSIPLLFHVDTLVVLVPHLNGRKLVVPYLNVYLLLVNRLFRDVR
jgi:hypothetical protein